MRIPTFLGLILLILALGAGIFLIRYQKNQNQQKVQEFLPKNILVSNLSDTSATISWEAKIPTKGSVIYVEKEVLKSRLCNFLTASCLQEIKRAAFPTTDDSPKETVDLREGKESISTTHYVVLDNLKSAAEYNFKVKNDNSLFPAKSLSFKTITKPNEQAQSLKPILGKVVDANIQPIKDALVSLKIPQAGLLTALTSSTGNFFIPLANVYKEDYSSSLKIEEGTKAMITIQKDGQISEVQISLPLANDRALPSITLGESVDFSEFTASTLNIENKFDLNNDGQLNALDLAIVTNNFSKNPEDTRMDFNSDGVIDQKDVDVLKKQLL